MTNNVFRTKKEKPNNNKTKKADLKTLPEPVIEPRTARTAV